MVRKNPRERFEDFVHAATGVFLEKGYRRTQMADVTAVLELSPGSIYRYFESKEALFEVVLRRAVDPGLPLHELPLPVPPRPREETLGWLAEQIAARTELPRLDEALNRTEPQDAAEELETIVLEILRALHGHRTALNLVERCALDWPEMAELWFEQGRAAVLMRLEDYLARRAKGGWFHPVPDAAAAARLFIEVVSFLAVHRHDDPYPVEMSRETAERLAVETLVRTHLQPRHPAGAPVSGAASRTRR